ncbi:MAG: Bax inhibitor-1/YccA family protein [Ruminiclostridium sp.]|nr:Bax inhibitor-1/YccA family protein [Ruminiclostridium sp.]
MASNNNNHVFTQNPIVRRISRINEYDGGTVCTYKGIAGKLLFFVLMVAVGVALCLIVKNSAFIAGETVFEGVLYEDSDPIVITKIDLILMGAATLISIIAPFVAIFARPAIPVVGSLFCVATGYMLSWLAVTFADQYMAPVLLALVITLIIVFTMGFLYGMGIIQVTQKVKTFIMTAMITVCVGSLLLLIGSFIPVVNGFVAQIMSNPVISIGGSVLMVIVGTLFLLVDFDTIRECVEKGLPKKYEWYAAYALAFSVIWLYFKVLQLVIKIMGKRD